MDTRGQYCQNERCPARGKVGEGNITIHSRKQRRYRCQRCGKTFAETVDTARYRLHKPLELFLLVVTLLSHVCPLPAIVAAFGLDERTVADWLEKAGVHCEEELPGYRVPPPEWVAPKRQDIPPRQQQLPAERLAA